MNKILSVISMAFLAFMLMGCGSIQTPNNVQLEKAIITGGSQEATIIALQRYPEYRPEIVLADGVLFSLANGTNFNITPLEVDSIMKANNVTNQVITTLLDNSIVVINNLNFNLGTNQTVIKLKDGLDCVAIGVSNGLAITAK